MKKSLQTITSEFLEDMSQVTLQKLSKEMNQVVKPAEIRALDNALRKMDKRGKSLLEELLGM